MSSRSFSWKSWAAFSALFFLVGFANLSCNAHAEDQAKKPADDAKGDESKAGEAKASDQADETPEQAVKRIAKLLRGGDKEGFETETTKFMEKFPNDPARWELKMIQAQMGLTSMGSKDADALKKTIGLLAEIEAAKDATAEIRERASLMSIQLQSGSSPERMTELVKHFIKEHPDSKMNGRLAMMLVSTVSRGEPEKALPEVEKLATSEFKPIAEAAKEKIGQLKALLELKTKPMELKFTAVDGREVDLAGQRGKIVLIDYWATWCGPCVAGLPEVIDLYGKYHDKGLEIVGISFDQDKDALTKFVEKKEMGWVQYFDGKGWMNEYGRKYGINAIPAMWLVDKDGKVIDFDARQNLADKIEKLFKE